MSEIVERLKRAYELWNNPPSDGLPEHAGVLLEAAAHIEAQDARIERLEKALTRLGSMEAFGLPFYNSGATTAGRELTLRIDYARAALGTKP